ncbi:SDR family NAD(P)-dependent oxidoreductase [Pseudonocardia nematodicida]|uniref:SDR family NAD(P)-dependent oxidoreductase n=1 Tax=Pseudonocardia nematodicida TaxID=1206997 RepID=A0ABV1KBA7_9PSEU
MTIDFTGRVAIVSGAGGGLGRAHALALAERGAAVVVNDVGGGVRGTGADTGPAERVAREIVDAGGDAIADTADVTSREAVDAMVAAAVERWGRVDIVINNAGILRDRTFAKLDVADFRTVLEVHLMGSVNVTQAAWGHMAAQGYGRVLMTTSVSGIYGNFGQSNYGAAKSALVGLTNVLAIEGERSGIRVNALAPTAATRMTEGLVEDDLLARITPETITPGALYLVSEQAPTKAILGAGAGVFAVSKMQEATGVHLSGDDLSPEGVAAHWDRISDLSEPQDIASAFEQTRRYVAMATAALPA